MKNKNNLLFLAVFILIAMIGFRIVYSQSLSYIFLIWNTFLAIVPFAISELMARLKLNKIQNAALVMISIVFLPNALYLISDFEHLVERPPVPFFFDILLMFYAALLGLLFNILSLRNLQTVAKRYLRSRLTNYAVGVVIFLSGFGVYLGRYLRWNSWDIITNPLPLFRDCLTRVLHPHEYYYTWAVSFGYAFILGFAYLFFVKSMDYDA